MFKKRKLLVEMHPFSMLGFGLEDDAVSKAVFLLFWFSAVQTAARCPVGNELRAS